MSFCKTGQVIVAGYHDESWRSTNHLCRTNGMKKPGRCGMHLISHHYIMLSRKNDITISDSLHRVTDTARRPSATLHALILLYMPHKIPPCPAPHDSRLMTASIPDPSPRTQHQRNNTRHKCNSDSRNITLPTEYALVL